MPALKRFRTRYEGVSYIEAKTIGTNKTEKIFYIRYRKDGKLIEEKAGRQSQDMSAAKASQIRARRIAGDECTNEERRAAQRAEKAQKAEKWTIPAIGGIF